MSYLIVDRSANDSSWPPPAGESVLYQAKTLVKAGYPELVLTGVQVGDYRSISSVGKDPGQNKVPNNEGAEAPCQQGARIDNPREYSTATDGGSAKRLSATIVAD